MELRQLRIFLSVARLGSFSKAAKENFLTQSAISQQIQSLEQELGTKLFVRTTHYTSLTESGEMLVPHAQKMVSMERDCVQKMADSKHGLCGELTLGLTYAMEPYMRRALVEFMRCYPKVRVNVWYESIKEMIEDMREGRMDMALSIIVEKNPDWVDSTPLVEDRIVAIMRDGHPLADRKELTIRELEKQNLILPEQGLRIYNAVNEFLSEEAAELNVRATVNNTSAIVNLLRDTNFITLLSVQSASLADDMVSVPVKGISQPVITYIHQRKGGERKRSAQEFIRILKDTVSMYKM